MGIVIALLSVWLFITPLNEEPINKEPGCTSVELGHLI
jgi:hypothetical protein